VDQNWIGGTSPLDAEYVPPPAARVGPLMEDLAAYLTSSEHPALVQAAVAHAQFETIHPFADGNGRAGRALILLVLRRRGVAPTVVPPVSLVLATRARAYIEALVGVRETDGSRQGLLDWVDLFVDATGRACGDTQDFAATLAVWDSQMRARAGRLRAGSAAASIVDALPALPVFTAGTMAQYLSRPPQKINEAIARLVQADVIRQVNVGMRRNRAFEAIDLFDRFTDFERGLAIDEEHGKRPAPPVPAP
jgi:Fic family protein